jgi:hypothetical protein
MNYTTNGLLTLILLAVLWGVDPTHTAFLACIFVVGFIKGAMK